MSQSLMNSVAYANKTSYIDKVCDFADNLQHLLKIVASCSK